MSQQKIYLSQEPTHISNYQGIFQTGENYQKFDFVYNTGDGRFYYARDDVNNSQSVISGEYRFTLDDVGPSNGGVETYYIYDEWNNSDELQEGQRISLQGSTVGSDGLYKILSIEKDFEEINHSSQAYDFNQVFDANHITSNWYQSSWFFRPNLGEDSILDYSAFSRDGDSSWIYNTLFGFIFVSLIEDGEQNFWFHSDLAEGLWFYADKAVLGNLNDQRNSFLYLENRSSSLSKAGSSSWLHWRNDPQGNYKALFYNYTDLQWFGFNSFNEIQKIDAPDLSIINAPEESVASLNNNGKNTRIRIQPVNESYQINSYETRSSNNIILSGILLDPSDDSDLWSKDRFFFDSDYGAIVNYKANNYKYQYGNGYYVVHPKNINSLTFEANLKFKNRTNREANAIIHFLENHQGQDAKDKPLSYLKYSQGISGFNWDGASSFHPYDSLDIQTKKFYCQDFSHSLNFEDSNDVLVKLRNLDTSILQKNDSLFVASAPTYSEDDYYEKNDVVFYTGNNQYYYFHSGEGQAQGLPPVEMHQEWTRELGNFSHINTGQWTRDFMWKPSLGLTVSQNPRLQEISLGAGYTQIYQDGINESLLTLEVQFNNRDDSEAYAILHFLEQHYGCIPFMFSAPAPYEAPHNFVCQEWQHIYNYKNNHSIRARFEQYAIDLNSDKIIDNETPASQARAEIIVNKTINFSSRDDEELIESLGEKGYIRKQINLKNIGDLNAEINLISTDSLNDEYHILGQNDFGSNYSPQGFSREDSMTNSQISDIYLSIMGEPMLDSYYINKSNEQQWKVADLVIAILNSQDFLLKSPTSKDIQIIYQDLIGETPTQSIINSLLNESSLNEVRLTIESSDVRANFLRNNPKVITQKITGTDRKICIPDNKLSDIGLNGMQIQLKKRTLSGRAFKVISTNENYFQNNQGIIIQESSGRSLESVDLYFVDQRVFELYSTNIIRGGEEGYIDLYFQIKAQADSFLTDSAGNEISWTDSFGREKGYIKIGRGINSVEGNLYIESQGDSLVSSLNAWVKFNDETIQEEEEISPWSYENVINAPFLFLNTPGFYINNTELQPSENRARAVIGFEIGQQDFKKLVGLWVPYEIKAYSENGDYESYVDSQEGVLELYENYVASAGAYAKPKKLWGLNYWFENGKDQGHTLPLSDDKSSIVLPRGSSYYYSFNDDSVIFQTSSHYYDFIEEDFSSKPLKFNTQNISSANTEDHTLIEVREIPQAELPNGYTKGYAQRGLTKITSRVLNSSFIESFIDSDSQFLFAEILCWLDNSVESCGNIEFSVLNSISEYGIVKASNNRYNVVKKAYAVSGQIYDMVENDSVSFDKIILLGQGGYHLESFSRNLWDKREIFIEQSVFDEAMNPLSLEEIEQVDFRITIGSDVLAYTIRDENVLYITKGIIELTEIDVSGDWTLSNAEYEWNKIINPTFGESKVKKMVYENQSCLKAWAHVLDRTSFNIVSDIYKSTYPELNSEYYSLQKSSLPQILNKGLEVDIDFKTELSEDHKKEIQDAVSTLESIVQDEFSINLTVLEDHHGRLGSSIESQNVVKITHTEKEFLNKGLAHLDRSNFANLYVGGFESYVIPDDNYFARRISAVMTIDPEKINNAEYNQIVNVNYDASQHTPVYYTVLHELINMLGVGFLWSQNRTWWKDDANVDAVYNLSENNSSVYQYIGDNAVLKYQELLQSYSQEGIVFDVNDYERYVDENPTVLDAYNAYLAEESEEEKQSKIEWGLNHWNAEGSSNTELNMPTNNPLSDFYKDKIPLTDSGLYLRSEVRNVSNEGVDKIQPTFPGEIGTDFGLTARAPAVPIINQGAALSEISIGMLKDLGYNVSYGPARPSDDQYLRPSINLK